MHQIYLQPRRLSLAEQELIQKYETSNEGVDFEAILFDFAFESSLLKCEFPATLTSQQRLLVHKLAGELDLEHQSMGTGASRHIIVSKKPGHGPAVAAAVQTPTETPTSETSTSSTSTSTSTPTTPTRSSPSRPSGASTASPSAKLTSLFQELSIQKPKCGADETVEHVYYKVRSYVGFAGELVDAVAMYDSIFGFHRDQAHPQSAKAKPLAEIVPADYRNKRASRDQTQRHHITLLTRMEIEQLQESGKIATLPELLRENIKDDWTDMGLGRVFNEQGTEEAFFRVLSWPSAQKFRKGLGLPEKDFHITIGFKREDIHDQPKRYSSLVFNAPESYWLRR